MRTWMFDNLKVPATKAEGGKRKKRRPREKENEWAEQTLQAEKDNQYEHISEMEKNNGRAPIDRAPGGHDVKVVEVKEPKTSPEEQDSEEKNTNSNKE